MSCSMPVRRDYHGVCFHITNWQMAQGLGCFLELGLVCFLEINSNDRECLRFSITSLVE